MADLESGLDDGDGLCGRGGGGDPFGHQADPAGPRDQMGNGEEVLRDDLRMGFDVFGVQLVRGREDRHGWR
ncbi:hypothetical protein AQJ64_36925 [Streptomyces griseoruber]|uniref:Uncharacterized protein n=1 Tax=Streptomyces griseoruber TaxID=1943 RepID=A0A101SMN3_9ACTN|nr:hypothetical protein AQJ64_36925 [Streptomyces griseoruber]